MITLISGTNRKESESQKFAKHIFQVLKQKTKEELKFFSLVDLPLEMFHTAMYSETTQSKDLAKIQDDCMIPAEKFIFILPEYNGSFPGVFKLFLDAISIRAYKATFSNKKVCLIGIAAGRAGNLRGLDHLTGILHHVGSHVMPNKLPISTIGNLTNEAGAITDKGTLTAIENQLDAFLVF